LLGLVAGSSAAEPATPGLGPAPRDAGGRFVNLAGEIERAGPGTTFPFFMRRLAGGFKTRPNPPTRVANDGAWLRENALHSDPSVTWVGHATLLVQLGHTTFLTDPIWSKTASPVSFAGPKRHVPPGIALEDLPAIDFVVVSHNHYDHLDLETLTWLAKHNAKTRFYVPLGNAELLQDAGIENVVELDWGDHVDHDGVRVTCVPTQHWSQRGLADRMKALWSSWVVTAEDRRFYFAGDTGAFEGFATIGAALGPFDLAALPIGAYKPVAMMKAFHMDPEEAVEAGRALRAERLVGMHFGTTSPSTSRRGAFARRAGRRATRRKTSGSSTSAKPGCSDRGTPAPLAHLGRDVPAGPGSPSSPGGGCEVASGSSLSTS
jgi:N-acyl-phosphatidylethanolamine-hydrolysing phospholipase D